MSHFAVHYRFIDRDTGQTGEGDALVGLDGEDAAGCLDLGCESPERRAWLEGHLADAIAKEFPRHKPGSLVVLVTAYSRAPEPT